LQPGRQPLSLPGAWPEVLDFFGTPLVIEPSPETWSGDGGLLPVCQSGQRLEFTQASPAARAGARDPDAIEHTPSGEGARSCLRHEGR